MDPVITPAVTAAAIAIWTAAKDFAKDQAIDALKGESKNQLNELRKKVTGDPVKKAVERALMKAITQFESDHHFDSLIVDANFLQGSAHKVLAKMLLPVAQPKPHELAQAWITSTVSNHVNVDTRNTTLRKIEPACAVFLQHFSDALAQEPVLIPILDAKYQLQISEDISALRYALTNDKATPATSLDYLRRIIDDFQYVNVAGSEQYLDLSLKLNEIYVGLQAHNEDNRQNDVLVEEESKNTLWDLESKTQANNENLKSVWIGRDSKLIENGPKILTVALNMVATKHEKAIILGLPGSGKSTLLKFLALQHAQALWGEDTEVITSNGESLGVARFPLFIRISEYAESFEKQPCALTDFLFPYFVSHEYQREGLKDLIETQLSKGQCLILLDGLDEITEVAIRSKVSDQIKEFIDRHDNANVRGMKNHFIVTSRIAGYRAAPLPSAFAHYVVHDMSPEHISIFLSQWCLAVERHLTPDAIPETHERNAKSEAAKVQYAIDNSIGVSKLAVNPLLLRTLAILSHISKTPLPARRVDLYQLVAKMMLRTWRQANRVDIKRLLDNERLIETLLSTLAEWLHTHKPTGLATRDEIHEALDKTLASARGITSWDPGYPRTDIQQELDGWIDIIREHTGLVLELAPNRFGFLHLTFQEFFTAKLIAKQRNQPRKDFITRHLHQARWREVLFLTLGLLEEGDASEILEYIMCCQDKAQYEDLLDRNFMFVLRCLTQGVRVEPELQSKWTEAATRKYLYGEGLGCYSAYCDRIHLLYSEMKTASIAARHICSIVMAAIKDTNSVVRTRSASILGQLGINDTQVISALIEAVSDPDSEVRASAIISLGQLEVCDEQVVTALITALNNSNHTIKLSAAYSVRQLNLYDNSNIKNFIIDSKDAAILNLKRSSL